MTEGNARYGNDIFRIITFFCVYFAALRDLFLFFVPPVIGYIIFYLITINFPACTLPEFVSSTVKR